MSFVLRYIVVIPFTVILYSVLALLVVFCNLSNRRRGRGTVLKEIVILVLHLLLTIVSGIVCVFSITNKLFELQVVQTVLLTLMSLFPLVVFVYMRCSFRTSPREDRRAGNLNRRDLQTAGLRTAPPSTRVSLPSDTAAHAPNFLSPSTAEPTDVTPLLSD